MEQLRGDRPPDRSQPEHGRADCTYDWNNNYYGPDTNNNDGSVPFPGSSYCSPVFFGPDDVLYGPVYSNDSIYVDGDPAFGVPASSGQVAVPSTVTTHDPDCLFVDPDKNEWKSGSGSGSCNTASSQVQEYNSATSTFGAPFEPIPATDTQLGTLAAQGGCEYSGPTTIYLYVNNAVSPALTYMTVTSPDTPTSGSTDLDNASTNTSNCGVGTNAGIGVPVPSGTKGNGVIFAENTPSSQTCVSGANPFEDTSNGDSGGDAQPSGTAYYDVSGTSEDCEADVFVCQRVVGARRLGQHPRVVGEPHHRQPEQHHHRREPHLHDRRLRFVVQQHLHGPVPVQLGGDAQRHPGPDRLPLRRGGPPDHAHRDDVQRFRLLLSLHHQRREPRAGLRDERRPQRAHLQPEHRVGPGRSTRRSWRSTTRSPSTTTRSATPRGRSPSTGRSPRTGGGPSACSTAARTRS